MSGMVSTREGGETPLGTGRCERGGWQLWADNAHPFTEGFTLTSASRWSAQESEGPHCP